MESYPTAAITIADGEITIDAELLASKLGLSAEAMKAEVCWCSLKTDQGWEPRGIPLGCG